MRPTPCFASGRHGPKVSPQWAWNSMNARGEGHGDAGRGRGCCAPAWPEEVPPRLGSRLLLRFSRFLRRPQALRTFGDWSRTGRGAICGSPCTAWTGEERLPSHWVRLCLLSDRLPETANEAAVCFGTTLGVVIGPYHLALERELERARRWQVDLSGTSAESWAKELAKSYEARIPQHRLIEEEDDLRFR